MTEFLPVSSSGHLVFFQSLFGLKEPPLFFDVLLHLATLLAVVVTFREDLVRMARGLICEVNGPKGQEEGARLLGWILLASLPTGLLGWFFKDWFEMFFSKPKVVAGMLLVTGLLLWLTRFVRRDGRPLAKMNWADAILIGLAQGLAITPGISRSGATIATGIYRGLDRELCGRFSFLVSIPAILGATLLEFRKIESLPEVWISVAGMGVAFGVGLLSLKFLMRIIRAGKISNFSYYCWMVGIVMLFLTG